MGGRERYSAWLEDGLCLSLFEFVFVLPETKVVRWLGGRVVEWSGSRVV